MGTEEVVGATVEKPKTKIYIADVKKEFTSKKEAEKFLRENNLAPQDVILRGKELATASTIAIV